MSKSLWLFAIWALFALSACGTSPTPAPGTGITPLTDPLLSDQAWLVGDWVSTKTGQQGYREIALSTQPRQFTYTWRGAQVQGTTGFLPALCSYRESSADFEVVAGAVSPPNPVTHAIRVRGARAELLDDSVRDPACQEFLRREQARLLQTPLWLSIYRDANGNLVQDGVFHRRDTGPGTPALQGTWRSGCHAPSGMVLGGTRSQVTELSFGGNRLTKVWISYSDSSCRQPLVSEKAEGAFATGSFAIPRPDWRFGELKTFDYVLVNSAVLPSSPEGVDTLRREFPGRNWQLGAWTAVADPRSIPQSTDGQALTYDIYQLDGTQLYFGVPKYAQRPEDRPVRLDQSIVYARTER
jgi:hypothetical protein